MEIERRAILPVFLAATAAGVGLHFLYDAAPGLLTMFLAPVNESIWEHLKLLFWPYLAGALWLCRGGRASRAPWAASLAVICAAMLLLGYGYHVLLRGEALAVDIGIYLLLMALGFWVLPPLLAPLTVRPHGREGAALAVTLLTILIFWFTIAPPDTPLFQDPASAAWATLPC